MNKDQGTVLEALGQVQTADVGRVFREYLRGVTREILARVMAEEVCELCGPAYHPDHTASCYRAGSAQGYVYMESRREEGPSTGPQADGRGHDRGSAAQQLQCRTGSERSSTVAVGGTTGRRLDAQGGKGRQRSTWQQPIAGVPAVAAGGTGEARRTETPTSG